MSEPAEIDAADVARKEFTTSFRGYDTYAVRAFLGHVAAELAAARERARSLSEQLKDATAKAQPVELGEAQLTAALGQEAGRLLQAAHEAAAEVRARAEADAAAMRSEAESLMGLRTAEANAAAEAIAATARQEAEAEVAAARQTGREMVAEAQAVRERVLRDLARRRRLAHAQLEQLRAGRERLLEAFRAVQGSYETATAELTSAEVEARAAADAAARRADAEPEPSIEELEAEVQAAKDAGLTVAPAAVIDEGAVRDEGAVGDVEAVAEAVAEAPNALYDVATEAAPGESEAVGTRGRRRRRREDPAPVPVADIGRDQQSSVRILRRDVPREPLIDLADPDGVETVVVETVEVTETVVVETVEVTETIEVVGTEDGIDAVFARLRADRSEPPDPEPVAEVAAIVEPEPQPEPVPPVAEDPVVDEAARAPFVVRDEALAPIEAGVVRRLKRVLSDEQNQVLDTLRRSKTLPGVDELVPAADEHEARYVDALVPALEQAALAGAGPKAKKVPAAIDLRAEAVAMVAEITADLRARADAAVADAGGDQAVVAEALSSGYREWKSSRIEPLVAHQLLVAHAEGAYAAAPAKPQRWMVDPATGCSPDCADNELGGPVRKGALFPTGVKRPPAFVGCRCLLVPA